MMNTYYIGGSPCSGKSTVAELLSKKYRRNQNIILMNFVLSQMSRAVGWEVSFCKRLKNV